jgi:hypothetical protein
MDNKRNNRVKNPEKAFEFLYSVGHKFTTISDDCLNCGVSYETLLGILLHQRQNKQHQSNCDEWIIKGIIE